MVIVGGGAGGITVAARLANALDNPDITIVEPSEIHLYQPGQTLIGGGVWGADDIVAKTGDYIPSGVTWEKDKVVELDPDNNKVVTAKGKTLEYDFLVMSPGIQLNYEKIEGLTQDQLGKDGIASIYTHEGCIKTYPLFKEMAERSKKEKINALFTHPDTPIKCGGAPKKIMYLFDGYLREHGNRENADMTFLPNGGKMFGVPAYNEAIENQYKERGMKREFKHNLVSVDPGKKEATFLHKYEVKGAWDEDLEEYDMIAKEELVTKPYDFLHITPPMSAPDFVKNSPLSWQKGGAAAGGWMEIDRYTMQHSRYPNVFGLGDAAGIPLGKTGGSVRKQAPVLVENMVAAMEGKELKAKYNGYTVCPLITGYGTVMLAEFDYDGIKPSFPLDPTRERWIWWILKVYMLKPMYYMGMLRGRA